MKLPYWLEETMFITGIGSALTIASVTAIALLTALFAVPLIIFILIIKWAIALFGGA